MTKFAKDSPIPCAARIHLLMMQSTTFETFANKTTMLQNISQMTGQHFALNFSQAIFRRFIRFQFNPFQVKLAAEPRQLPLGKLPRAAFHQINRFRQTAFAAQMFRHLPVADGLHRRFVLLQGRA